MKTVFSLLFLVQALDPTNSTGTLAPAAGQFSGERPTEIFVEQLEIRWVLHGFLHGFILWFLHGFTNFYHVVICYMFFFLPPMVLQGMVYGFAAKKHFLECQPLFNCLFHLG